MLAEELQCRLEFVPFEYENIGEQLDANHFDVAMSGIPITTSNLLNMRFSRSYLDVSISLVVRDFRRKQFDTVEELEAMPDLTVAVPHDDYFHQKVQSRFPQAQLVALGSVREFFESDQPSDALLIDAESGAAWTFLYPGYRPVVPRGLQIKQPLGFAVVRQDRELAEFLSHWLDLKRQTGELDELYKYWILGEVETDRPPRWSILRNVLGVKTE